MNAELKAPAIALEASATVKAAQHIWREISAACQRRDAADIVIDKLGSALELLIEDLSEPLQSDFRQKLASVRKGSSLATPRVGEVSGNVIQLFRENERRGWSVSEVQNQLQVLGKPADSKAVYNTMNYLAKTGILERLSRGIYRLREAGFGLDADQLPDDGTTRASEHY